MMYQRKQITRVTASAPGRIILFGDYALLRGQPALAAAVGLYTRCKIRRRQDGQVRLSGGGREQTVAAGEVKETAKRVEGMLAGKDAEGLRKLAREDALAAAKYVIGAGFEGALLSPEGEGVDVEWEGQVPAGAGLGAGASAVAALVTAGAAMFRNAPAADVRAGLAHRADQVAHGGAATSALDTQAALMGGVIRYIGKGMGERVPCAPGVGLVIGLEGDAGKDSGSAVDAEAHIRAWLAEKPSRITYFETIGALTRTALSVVQRGDWPEVGRLMNLNQMVLEKVGVSSSAMEKLIDAAWNAGALGAKITGVGRAMIALTTPAARRTVADIMTAAGGVALTPELPAHGARVEEEG